MDTSQNPSVSCLSSNNITDSCSLKHLMYYYSISRLDAAELSCQRVQIITGPQGQVWNKHPDIYLRDCEGADVPSLKKRHYAFVLNFHHIGEAHVSDCIKSLLTHKFFKRFKLCAIRNCHIYRGRSALIKLWF